MLLLTTAGALRSKQPFKTAMSVTLCATQHTAHSMLVLVQCLHVTTAKGARFRHQRTSLQSTSVQVKVQWKVLWCYHGMHQGFCSLQLW